MRFSRHFVAIAIALLAVNSSATTYFVDLNSTNPVAPYTNWLTAATNIQDAINAASLATDVVLVTNGVYQYGGDSYNGSNRVHVTGGKTLRSVNGPAMTIIKGYQVPGTTNGPGAVRCVYLQAFSTLSGFTLTGGATDTSGSPNVLTGGGLLSENTCTISNCVISGNASFGNGGGAWLGGSGTFLLNSSVSGNIAFNNGSGGGVYGSGTSSFGTSLLQCVVSNNIAATGGGIVNCSAYDVLLVGNGTTNNLNGTSGGAAYLSALNNCTVSGNFSHGLGAADGCTLNNSIIYYNFNNGYADCYQCQLTNCCTTIGLGTPTLSNNSFSNAPGFVNPAAGDYHLNPWSRCIDAGTAPFFTNTVDLDGNPRVVGLSDDLGAYENQSPFQGGAHYVSLLSTNPVAPYTNWSTAATNIQDAVGAAQSGEFIIAGDGVYTNGGTVVFGAESNRVTLTNAVTLVSSGGSQAASITGGTLMRCVFVGSNATLIGFTLTNGHASVSGDITNEQSGGGAWCAAGGLVSNCVAVGNFAGSGSGLGGGIFGGAVWNCTLMNNNAANGGGAAVANLYNCMVISNCWQSTANYGGGLYAGTASNCNFSFNRAYTGAGGVYQSTLHNCALNTNLSTFAAGGAYFSQLYGCTLNGNQGSTGGARSCTNYNCTFQGNTGLDGGGADGGVSFGCIFTGNSSPNGGGALTGTFYNCLFTANRANFGGGVQNCTLYNCTVAGNTGTNGPGGVYNISGSVYNSIIYYNFSPSAATNYYALGGLFNCCTTPQFAGNSTCFTNDPLFVNLAGGDLHLQSNSPCINSGNSSYITNVVMLTNDLDGNPRIVSAAVDVGAYEFQSPASLLPYSWLWLYGLSTDGSADGADSDGDGMSNYAEWRARTNPTDASSVLALQAPVVTETNATITWQSVFGVHYYIQSTPDFLAQPFQTIASDVLGSAGTTSYTDTNAVPGATLFYRVGVQ